jgi:ubiquitin-conjugating enzyme E2 variant
MPWLAPLDINPCANATYFCAFLCQVLLGAGRTPVVAALQVLEDQPAPATTSSSSSDTAAATADETSSSSSSGARGSSKWVIDENELLASTWEHRAWTWGSMALMGGALASSLTHIHGSADSLAAAGAVLAAYVLSDLGTGVYHWGVDNYGDGSTPVFGRQIAAFQGHHQRPWTITQREFCNNVHQVRPGTRQPAFNLAVGSLQGCLCH